MARPLLFVMLSFGAASQTTPVTWRHATIALERTPCFGTYPHTP
jgi:hypothetical protein